VIKQGMSFLSLQGVANEQERKDDSDSDSDSSISSMNTVVDRKTYNKNKKNNI
jgi:hypothetical protein